MKNRKCKQAQSIQDRIISELEAAPAQGKRFWTDFERAMLTKYYGKKEIKTIAKILNRTVSAVSRQASFMGLTHKHF